MEPISGMVAGAVRPPEGVREQSGAGRPEEEPRPLKPVRDEYTPEEKREPSGLYWPGRDEDGQPKICFDRPEEGPEEPEAGPAEPGAPEKRGGKEERCVGNTDEVDREIRRLKQKRAELEQRLSAETDEARVRDLERRLAQVERELSEKDSDAYRRQHSTFTCLS